MNSFDIKHDRTHTRSVKWDSLNSTFQAEDIIPLWIADMDFTAPDAVNEALIKRAKHGIYGYTIVDEDITNPIVKWINEHHKWPIEPNWLSFSPSVVASIAMSIEAFTNPGDQILIQTPVYTPFFKMIKDHDRKLVTSSLIDNQGHFEMDFTDIEEKFKNQNITAFLLCSPHNPVGRVWTKDELTRLANLCVQYDVLILSDEIHCDLVYEGHQHIPIASLSEEIAQQTVTYMAPSKTFNMAGLQASFSIIKNDTLRRKQEFTLQKAGHKQLNTMGNMALEAVYKHGGEWLQDLLSRLTQHKNYVINTFKKEAPEIRIIEPEGTYLLWLDCSKLGFTPLELQQFMIQQAKVGLNAGLAYGEEGSQFMRMNIACHPDILEQAVNQMIHAISKHQESK